MKVSTIAVALAAFFALYGVPSTDAAISESQIKKKCQAMKVCYKAGNLGVKCTISNLACPPCVTFADSGCFEYEVGTTTCPFSGGSYDCTSYWNADGGSDSTSSGSGSGKSDPSGEAGSGSTPKNTTGNSTASSSSSSGSSVGAAGNAGSAATADGGSDMSVVFAIIGAAIGVIAVAVIFLTLVRRSRAAHDEEDDMAATPPAMTKDPSSTTGAVTYATYGGRGGGGAGTTEPSVTSYYSQQPQNLPIASPRVAGRAVPASPRVTAGRAVPVSAPRPQPTPTGSVSRAMPVFANKAPLSTPQQQQQQQTVYQQAAPVYTSAPAPAVAVYQQAPPHVQDPARRASSPRSRRESYEF